MSKGRNKNKSKRTLTSLPKGIPQKANKNNPFDYKQTSRRVKHEVLNRRIGNSNKTKAVARTSALAQAIERRRDGLRASIERKKKVNSFVDRRIGEKPSSEMTQEQIAIARIVKERVSRSKKHSRYNLDDIEGGSGNGLQSLGGLTHKGQEIDENYTGKGYEEDLVSDDDDYYDDKGTLDRVDTEMHFGGGKFDRSQNQNPYGHSSKSLNLGDVYRSRKEEMDDMIKRKKIEKAERQQSKEDQVEKFEGMDESFKELAGLLDFRDKDEEYKKTAEKRKAGTLSKDELEMEDWNKEMKSYLFERKVKATDRTKTPDEIAKEEAERLQEFETKRLARMNGDFEDDDLSDISDDEDKASKGKKKRKKQKKGDDELDSDNEADDDENNVGMQFTADGIVYYDKKTGKTVKNPDEKEDSEVEDEDSDDSESDNDEIGDSGDEASAMSDDDDDDVVVTEYKVGMKVTARYSVAEQLQWGEENWFKGKIEKVGRDKKGNKVYDVAFDDGDFETEIKPEYIRPVEKTKEEKKAEKEQKSERTNLVKKKKKATKIAQESIPFVFEVPTTLEALHDLIATHATTGEEATLIIQRIHASNSVRLNKNNKEKMQNFYDVVLRRFLAVGDALYREGNGGPDLGRYSQLDNLTNTLYNMAQDSPEIAGSVWSRRLGILQKAFGKKIRDSELISSFADDEFTAWPSMGTFLLLRALGHIFPVTDLRHSVVTPAIIFMGQTLAQAPVRNLEDLRMGILVASLIIEYTKEAKRLCPEAIAFLAGVIRLYAVTPEKSSSANPIPSLEAVITNNFLKNDLREHIQKYKPTKKKSSQVPQISLNVGEDEDDEHLLAVGIFCSALKLIEVVSNIYRDSLNHAEADVFSEISQSLISLELNSKKKGKLHSSLSSLISRAASSLSQTCQLDQPRPPLKRRKQGKPSEYAIKSLAPKMEDPSKYSMSKDKGKSAKQAEIDRNRREYKREHKAINRELRLDAAFTEQERRRNAEKSERKEKAKRHKNFAWMEQEQATMNQQVRKGGGLLSGGGIGAARAKAASARLGIKKGGKFR